MSSIAEELAVVVVQGSFQTSLVYQKLSDTIRARGYQTFQPELPSCSNTDNPDFSSKTLQDDSDAVSLVLERLINNQGKRVVVVMHSYGGIVGSNAIPEELSYEFRKEKGLKGGVIYLYYFAAFVLDKGQSVLSAFGESPNNDVRVSPDGTFCVTEGAKRLYNNLPETEAKMWESRMVYQSHAVQTTEITHTAYKYIPSTYLICEGDNAVPFQIHEMFAAAAGSEVDRCDAGHSPMLSQCEMLVHKIVAAIEKTNS
ncbi:catalytic protein [Lophiotrema nucula]|uniref:Catalytic protein n=1 Tax=Lophiotrema nucula TaxID=690887 RepID=A0A6A5YEX5_9PLEO|nr:catalytic protein [Lophiotrema nucula]